MLADAWGSDLYAVRAAQAERRERFNLGRGPDFAVEVILGGDLLYEHRTDPPCSLPLPRRQGDGALVQENAEYGLRPGNCGGPCPLNQGA